MKKTNFLLSLIVAVAITTAICTGFNQFLIYKSVQDINNVLKTELEDTTELNDIEYYSIEIPEKI